MTVNVRVTVMRIVSQTRRSEMEAYIQASQGLKVKHRIRNKGGDRVSVVQRRHVTQGEDEGPGSGYGSDEGNVTVCVRSGVWILRWSDSEK